MGTLHKQSAHKRIAWTAGLLAVTTLVLVGCTRAPSPNPTPTPILVSTSVPSPTATPGPAVSTPTPRPSVPGKGTDASPPAELPEYPGGAGGFSHFVFEKIQDRVVTSLVEGPRGPQVRTSYSLPALRQLLASGEPVPPELQMSQDELEALVQQLDAIRVATERYRDVDLALADGYTQETAVVPNMGAHFIHRGRVRDGILNLAEPEILIYDLDETGGWHLRGTSFLLPWRIVGDQHPEGFVGPLDNWHVHYSLCISPELNSRTADAQACEQTGGRFLRTLGWMIHAWVHDDNPMGVFSMWNSNVPPLVPQESIRNIREAVSVPTDGTHPPEVPTDLGSRLVNIENFQHSTIEVVAGQMVTWLNVDGAPHTVTSGSSGIASGGFDSDLLGPGQAFSRRFEQPGRFSFTCLLHPQMNGTVLVTPAEHR